MMSKGRIVVLDAPSWINTGHIDADDLSGLLASKCNVAGPWEGILALYTDKVEWTVPEEMDVDHIANLLELRAYNHQSEVYASRSDIVSEFAWRLVCDETRLEESTSYDARLDEEQYLDIDSTKSSGKNYVATGGGFYQLPIEGAERVRVRNYIVYGDEDGMARFVDFRIVELLRGRE